MNWQFNQHQPKNALLRHDYGYRPLQKSTTPGASGWRSGDKNSGEYHWEKHTTRWPLARVGGEEFGVLLTDIDTERAKALAERIRENVERLTGDNPEYAIPQKVTISIGAVVTQENALNPNEIYRLADNALYEAKETGRNKVVVRMWWIFVSHHKAAFWSYP